MRCALVQRTTFGHTSQAMVEIPERPAAPLQVAVSDCLLGSPVRYDGGHKKSSLPHEELAGLFEFIGYCPEMAIGLGTPRAPIRLVGLVDEPRAVGQTNQRDVTDALQAEAERVAPGLRAVSAYVFMKNSPSCGLFRVKVYDDNNVPTAAGSGVYAQHLRKRLPEMPMEESGRLFDPVLRENFVTRVFVYAHWQLLISTGPSAAQLIEFHARYKYLLMAHSVAHTISAGRLLSNLSGGADQILACGQAYFCELMAGLSKPATRGGHANVLAHLQGYVKQALSSADRSELAGLIESYRSGSQPLLAPLTLLRHHLHHHGSDYALRQIYLEPHPESAALRLRL